MCVTTGKSRMTGTKLFAAALRSGQHVLGYQNTVQNIGGPVYRQRRSEPNDRRFTSMRGGRSRTADSQFTSLKPPPGFSFSDNEGTKTGNAMILMFPAVPGTMSRGSILDTSRAPHILSDMARAIEPISKSPLRMERMIGAPKSRVQHFESGIYEILMSDDLAGIGDKLVDVKPEKRPSLPSWLLPAYGEWYQNWTAALCCFNNTEAAEADPMLWLYQPMYPDTLFLPALDAHDGEKPDLDARVRLDHSVMLSAYGMQKGATVHYTNDKFTPALRRVLPTRVIGGKFEAEMPNGDFICAVDDVRNGVFRPRRIRPMAA